MARDRTRAHSSLAPCQAKDLPGVRTAWRTIPTTPYLGSIMYGMGWIHREIDGGGPHPTPLRSVPDDHLPSNKLCAPRLSSLHSALLLVLYNTYTMSHSQGVDFAPEYEDDDDDDDDMAIYGFFSQELPLDTPRPYLAWETPSEAIVVYAPLEHQRQGCLVSGNQNQDSDPLPAHALVWQQAVCTRYNHLRSYVCLVYLGICTVAQFCTSHPSIPCTSSHRITPQAAANSEISFGAMCTDG
jgi:hypothetical protein